MLTTIAATALVSSAVGALEGRAECVLFTWHGENGRRGAMSIPVTVDGRSLQWQVDTGADVNMSYGDVADQLNLSKKNDRRFRVRSLLIGTTNIADSLTFIRREMTGNDAVTGTLELNSLMGRVAVIDYPRKRFCLFNEGNLPAPFWDATFANAIFRDRKFFLPVRVGNFASDAMFFDTGASEVPLHVNRTIWSQLTGKTSVADAETEIEGQAWGVPIRLFGARSKTSSTIGGVKIGSPVIYTTQTSKAIASDHQRIDGVIGNTPFWNGIVVLDLTVRMRFAYIRPEGLGLKPLRRRRCAGGGR